MKKIADEDKRELLQEVITSAGWGVFCNTVVSEILNKYSADLFTAARNGDNTDNPIGRYDAICELLKSTYEAANLELPEFFNKLRRNGI